MENKSTKLLVEITKPGIKLVNDLILKKMHSDIELISQISSHILLAGGKRFRPMLSLCSSLLIDNNLLDEDISLSAAIELIHTATLLHDDVIDKSNTRRGSKTANNIWGNQVSVLVGDYLFSKAFELMVETRSLEVLKTLAFASNKITEGEIMQLKNQNSPGIDKEDYFRAIKGKTAELFSAACKSGGIIKSANEKELKALENFGMHLGIAFQLIDDTFDYQPKLKNITKKTTNDFENCKVSLPTIICWESANKEELSFWSRTIGEAIQTKGDFDIAIKLIEKYNAIEKTIEVAKKHIEIAIDSISVFRECEAKYALIEASKFSVNRIN
tara:strand:- start:835 stop:1821 length:987 start_codon:yes stop_codon:yes gene_type:complete